MGMVPKWFWRDRRLGVKYPARSFLAVLVSGSGTNLQAVLDACESGRIQAEVRLVVSNRRDAYGLVRAAAVNVPTAYHPLRPYTDGGLSRRRYDADLAVIVEAVEPDWVLLAGWMHVLSSAFLDRFPGRVVNLHPALPGQFAGPHAIADAFNASRTQGLTTTGVMVHLVPDERVDQGPVLASREVPILMSDTLGSLTERVHEVEHDLLVETLAQLTLIKPTHLEPQPATEADR